MVKKMTNQQVQRYCGIVEILYNSVQPMTYDEIVERLHKRGDGSADYKTVYTLMGYISGEKPVVQGKRGRFDTFFIPREEKSRHFSNCVRNYLACELGDEQGYFSVKRYAEFIRDCTDNDRRSRVIMQVDRLLEDDEAG